MDRLLSEKEQDRAIKDFLKMAQGEHKTDFMSPNTKRFLTYDALCNAQDIKTSKWWIKKIENQRDNICCIGEATTKCPLADPCCSFMRESCTWWQQLKSEVKK